MAMPRAGVTAGPVISKQLNCDACTCAKKAKGEKAARHSANEARVAKAKSGFRLVLETRKSSVVCSHRLEDGVRVAGIEDERHHSLGSWNVGKGEATWSRIAHLSLLQACAQLRQRGSLKWADVLTREWGGCAHEGVAVHGELGLVLRKGGALLEAVEITEPLRLRRHGRCLGVLVSACEKVARAARV